MSDEQTVSSQTLASFVPPGGTATIGLVVDDVVIDLSELAAQAPGFAADADAVQAWHRTPERLERFLAIDGWSDIVDDADARVRAGEVPESASHALADVQLLPPVHHPEKIVCVGLNYRTHIEEAGRDIPEYPMLFGKFNNTIAGPHDDVPIPHATHRIDYEGELTIVVGKEAFEVDAADADDVIAGLTVANDVSARDYQFRTRQLFQGKAFDKFCPVGPWVRRFPSGTDLHDWRLRTWVNDEQRQDAFLGDLVFDVPFLIAYLSQIMTLRPGDLILTGTPGGIGAAMDPRRWLRAGDVCTIEIDNIGTIRNTFVAPRET